MLQSLDKYFIIVGINNTLGNNLLPKDLSPNVRKNRTLNQLLISQ